MFNSTMILEKSSCSWHSILSRTTTNNITVQ